MSWIKNAVAGRRIVGVASGDGRRRFKERRRAAGRVELRQAVERLVRVTIVRPVFPHRAEVVIERPILLGKKHDVLDRRKIRHSERERRRH